MLLLWVSASLYTRRRPDVHGRNRRFVLVATLAPVTLLIFWVVFWILPNGVLPELPMMPPAVYLVVTMSVLLLSALWFILEMLIFLLVPLYRPHQ
jgi:hypothetical protein